MQRPIKFRVIFLEVEERKAHKGQPVYWSPEDEQGSLGHVLRFPQRYAVSQFTGLLDKNGKEIYEGDRLKVNGVHTLEVMWCNGAWKYMETDSMVSMSFGDGWLHDFLSYCHCPNAELPKLEHIEVIGNIYENPDLLEPQTKAEVFEAMKESARESQPTSFSGNPVCEECEDTGGTYIPASQVEGSIRDGEQVKCICQKRVENEDDDSYWM